MLTVHVTLTPREISYRTNFREKVIGWESVQSFQVVPDARENWSAVGVDVRSRGIVRLPIAGSQRYVRRVMHEIEAYRAGLPPAGLTPGRQQPESREPDL